MTMYKYSLFIKIFSIMKIISQQLNSDLISKSLQLERFTSILKGELPAETSGHYHVADVDNSTLVIVTDSPVWTARLRQLGPSIIQLLSDEIKTGLQHVRIISRHGSITAPQRPKVQIKRVLSKKSAHQVATAAKYIKDQKLKAALLKLSQRGGEE